MDETLGNKPILGCLSNKDKHPSKGDAIKYIYIDSQQKILFAELYQQTRLTGKILAPPEYASEQPQRGGHIPGAINIPWDWAVNEDGTFKSADELEKIYASMDVAHNKEVITYCRIGERSAYTWFVLKYLLGYPNVKNYEGSWAEWGSTVGNPIEK